jgi:rubrerythrin
MSFVTFKDVVRYAVEKEEEAIQFYTDAAQQEQYAAARSTFLKFAEEEKKHKALFADLDLEAAENFEASKIPDLKRSDPMVEIEQVPDMSYIEILRLAMKREENAKNFYDDCTRLLTINNQQKFFQMLSEEEAKHKLALETLYDDVMAKGGD